MVDDFDNDGETTPDGRPHERRGEDRVDASFRVRYKTLDDFVVAYSTDISRGGLFIATDNFMPIGSVVKLELCLPEGGPTVSVIARVAFIMDEDTARPKGRRPGMGMEFLDVEGEPIAVQLASYLTSQLSGYDASVDTEPSARIVVVDDDSTYRDQAASALRESGHEVTTAEHGLQGLGLVLREAPDLILSDVQMPNMDGWQLLRMIRARPNLATTPFVFFTSLSGEAERLKGYQLGVDDYIAKPFSSDELVVRITKVLGRSRQRPRGSADNNALRGDLAQVGLQSVLSFIDMEKRSGTLLIVSGNDLITLHCRDGQVVQVDLPASEDHRKGLERVFYALDLTEGRFDLTAAEITAEDSIGVPTSYALLEHARKVDEGNQ